MDEHDADPLFGHAADTGEILLAGHLGIEPGRDPAYTVWRAAHVDAEDAWQLWRRTREASAYVAYRAALDREDVAQDWLASASERTASDERPHQRRGRRQPRR